MVFIKHKNNSDFKTFISVLFFTFINPETMTVPNSFKKLGEYFSDLSCIPGQKNISIFSAASRGTGGVGSVPANTRIIFAIGG